MKYYSFISLQESIDDKTEALCLLRPKVFNFVKEVNKVSTAGREEQESLFLLEAYLDQISIISESSSEDGSAQILQLIEKMNKICE